MDIHSAFRYGAKKLAVENCRYSELHKSHGIDEANWILLTQAEYWSPDQAMQVRSILAAVLEVSMTIANMPSIALPGHYAAAVIAEIVSPCNRFVAAMKAPDTFDAADASGLLTTSEVKTMSKEQMISLVLAYSSGYEHEPPAQKLPKAVGKAVKQAAEKA